MKEIVDGIWADEEDQEGEMFHLTLQGWSRGVRAELDEAEVKELVGFCRRWLDHREALRAAKPEVTNG